MGYFNVPTRSVRVEFVDGRTRCVAYAYGLHPIDVAMYRRIWKSEGEIKRIWLEDKKGNILRNYVNENGNMVEASLEIKDKGV